MADSGDETRRAGADDVLRTTSGMLDDEWFSRARWYLGDRPIAEYLVFDDAAPVLDGMAVSGGRLFVSTVDGKVLCYAQPTVAQRRWRQERGRGTGDRPAGT